MKLAHKKSEVRHIVAAWHQNQNKVALVPTMGALHQGHVSLIRQARSCADHVVVSIFVNPVQFGPGEDFENYPRTLGKDVEICRKEGVSLVFAPDVKEMYGPEGSGTNQFIQFRISKMNEHLCGVSRQGHFEGVLQVVNKLFHVVSPDIAVFGQKDIQQWFVIRQMVEEHDLPVKIRMSPTMRESDGLALSSRNAYLTASERQKAPLLYEVLQKIAEKLTADSGPPGSVQNKKYIPVDKTLILPEKKRMEENGFNVDYLSVVSVPDLQPADVIESGRIYVAAVAAWLGKTRLIDNILLNARPSDYDT